MRRPASQGKRDANQGRIVKQLEQIPGVRVIDLGGVGGGVPDLLVAYAGKNYLFEVKDPRARSDVRKLNTKQQEWHLDWTGQAAMIFYVTQALEVMNIPYIVNGGTAHEDGE